MGFYGKYFIYDDVPSSNYNLIISNMDSGSDHSGANVELMTQEVYRRPKVYLLGVQQKPVLEIPITITVNGELSALEASSASRWLFGQMSYKKLQIIQSDMQYVYYNCIFTNPEIIRIGNIIRGYNATIVCDSPFAWEYPIKKRFTFGLENYTINKRIVINNLSESSDYSYPIVTVKMNSFGGSISLKNASDSNRNFRFTGLDPAEVITVNNEIQTISSSTGENRFSNFTGYKWFRLKPKDNTIIISGNIHYFEYTNQIARKIA